MKARTITCAGIALILLLVASTRLPAQPPLFGNPANQVVIAATNVLVQTNSMPSGIPHKLMAEAQGIVIVPNMVRGAFIIGVQHGRGVLVTRGPNGAWQPPRMIQITGGSLGYQVGVQSTDLILVFRTPRSVQNLLNGTLKIGVDASAAAGPVGRQGSAATDLQLQAEILSYSRARGAFIGVSIDGSVISLDPAADRAYYQPPGTIPASAVQLMQYLTEYSGGPAAPSSPPLTAVVPAPTGLPPAERSAPPTAPPTAPPAVSATPTPPPAATPVSPPTATPTAPPGVTVAAMPPVPETPSEIERVREQLDAVSRKLAESLDDKWKKYLALPPEIYIPYQTPNPQVLQQAIAHYERVSRDPRFEALNSRPDFQATLKTLWRLAELQSDANTPVQLPPPPQ